MDEVWNISTSVLVLLEVYVRMLGVFVELMVWWSDGGDQVSASLGRSERGLVVWCNIHGN
jgi:hypothetical protein